MRVAVVVDSALDIPVALLEEYGITQVPVHITWQGQNYRDKIDMDLEELFKLGQGTKDFPKTSQPSPGEFAQVYSELAKDADLILSWHIASKLSGTWAAAQAGADLVKDLVTVQAIDTASVSMGGGLQALACAKALKFGASAQVAVEAGKKVGERVEIRLILNTLDYVLRGGRVSKLEATIGSLLNIKPMLSIKDGVIDSAGKARSRKRSLDMLLNTVTKASNPHGNGLVAAIGHAGAQQELEAISSQLKQILPGIQLIPYQVGVAIGAHGGPGVLGICYYNEDI